MNKILRSELRGASVWNAKTFENDNSWIYSFSSEELSEIDIALKVLKTTDLIFPNFSKTDFQLPNLQKS